MNELYNDPNPLFRWIGEKHPLLPRSFPEPPDRRFRRKWPCKYSGFSEKVETNIANRWKVVFGEKWASYDGKWMDQSVNGTQNLWEAWQVRPGNHDHYWQPLLTDRAYEVFGKWYRSSGKLTVLTVPEGSSLLP